MSFIKDFKVKYCIKRDIKREYKNDCREYIKYHYNNSNIKTKNAIEAKILRQAHILEKGMSLSNPREKFGVQKAHELLDMIDKYISLGFEIKNSSPVINGIGVLNAYLNFHKNRGEGYEPVDVISRFKGFKKYLSSNNYGIKSISYNEINNLIGGNFESFFKSRHSVRQFASKPVSTDDIKKVVTLAMRAPSACNRQSCKAYFYNDSRVNTELGKLIAGNTGFEDETQNYLVVTSDMSAFYNSFERNQVYVDGGIFAMALVECLHYYGIASCILQNGEFKDKNKKIKKICKNIPENEKIILFIAIGYYKDNVVYATSHRKKLDDVLKIK